MAWERHEVNKAADVDTTGLTNGKVLKWNGLTSKWTPNDDTAGIPEAPIDTFGYARKDGAWELVANVEPLPSYGTIINNHTTSINTINGQQTTQDSRLTALEGDVLNLDGQVLNLQNDLANLEMVNLQDVDPNLNPTNG